MENTLLFIGSIGPVELMLILIFLGIPAILWIWAIVDILRSDFTDSTTKLIWLIVIVFLPVLGAILYLLIGRNQKVKHQRQ